MQQSAFVLPAADVAHLDLDDAVALRERQGRTKQIAREIVPARSDPDRDGERQTTRDRQARILHEHPDTQLVVLQHAASPVRLEIVLTRARTSAAAMSTVSIAVSRRAASRP